MNNKQIPIQSIIAKLDAYLNREEYENADRFLRHWQKEAYLLGDRRGELSVLSEIMGFSRRIQDRKWGMDAVWRGFELIEEIKPEPISAGTIYLNGATTLKAFGQAKDGLHYYKKAGDCFLKALPENDPLWGGFYNNYGLALADVERYDEALDCYQKAMNVMAHKEHGDLEIAVTLMNVAELFERMGEDSAIINNVLDQVNDCLENPELPRNGYYAFVCRKCAPTFGHFGRHDREQQLNERATKIYEGN